MKSKTFLVSALAVILCLALVLPLGIGCAKPAPVEPGAEVKKPIKFVDIDDLSGPAAPTCIALSKAMLDYVQRYNEDGGIDGHMLELELFDGKLDPTIALPAYKRYAAELETKLIYSAIAYCFSGPEVTARESKCAIVGMSANPKITLMTKADYDAGMENYYFGTTGISSDRMKLAVDTARKWWKEKGETRPIKIGAFNEDNVTGHSSAAAAALRCSQVDDAEFVGATYAAREPTDTVAQVSSLKKWGADATITGPYYEAAMIVYLRELERQDYDPMTLFHCDLLTGAVATGDPAFVGAYGYAYQAAWEDMDVPEIQKAREAYSRYHPEGTYEAPHYFGGWFGAMICVEAMERVAEKYGVDALFTEDSGTYIKEALESFDKFDTNGIVGAVTYTERDHRGSTALNWWQVTEPGKITKVEDFMFPPPLTEEEYDWKFWTELEKDI